MKKKEKNKKTDLQPPNLISQLNHVKIPFYPPIFNSLVIFLNGKNVILLCNTHSKTLIPFSLFL